MTDAELNIKIEALKELIESRMCGLKKLLDERHEFTQTALEKAETSMVKRLETMNEFRSQIQEERSTYITKEILDLTVKERNQRLDAISVRLEALEKANAFASGKLWMIMFLASLVPTILALIAIFK